MLGIDECGDAAHLLRFCDRMQCQRRLTGGLRPIDLDDTAARITADTDSDVKGERARRDDLDIELISHFAKTHDGAGTKFLGDLLHRIFECLLSVLLCIHFFRDCHRYLLENQVSNRFLILQLYDTARGKDSEPQIKSRSRSSLYFSKHFINQTQKPAALSTRRVSQGYM